MKRIIFTLAMAFVSWLGACAGSLNNWTNYNFQGVWEITSTDPDNSLDWLVRSAGLYPGETPVTRVELALDGFGRGYFAYYSESMARQSNVLGRIFVPHPNDNCSDSLCLLVDLYGQTAIAGFMTFYVGACDNDQSDKDHINIYPINGALGSARATRINQFYTGNEVAQLPVSSLHLIFQKDGISLIDAENSEVIVYDLDGVLYYHSKDYAGETISLPKGKHYVFKVDDEAMKVAF